MVDLVLRSRTGNWGISCVVVWWSYLAELAGYSVEISASIVSCDSHLCVICGFCVDRSPLFDLLERGDYTLEELLAEDELLQEVKSKNDQLIHLYVSMCCPSIYTLFCAKIR